MGTLTIQGITWTYLSFNGKVAFGFGDHAIHYVPSTGLFHIKEKGETISVSKQVSECLEEASTIVWEYLASKITPSWEHDHGQQDQTTSAA